MIFCLRELFPKVKFPKSLLGWLFGLGQLAGMAQTPALPLEQIALPKGRMDQIVYDLAQDEQGFLWLGTPSGLIRYDGHEFRPFSMVPDDREQLRATRVNQVIEGGSGMLWYLIGHGNKSLLRVLELATGQHRSIRYAGKPLYLEYDGANYQDILAADSRGGMWLRSNHGLYRVLAGAGQEDHSVVHFQASAEASGLASDTVQALRFDRYDRLWIGTASGLSLYLPESDTLQEIEAFENRSVISLHETAAGMLLVGTRSSGLFALPIEPTPGGRFSNVEGGAPPSQPVPAVFKIAQDAQGATWVLLFEPSRRIHRVKRLPRGAPWESVFHPPWIVSEQVERFYGNVNFFPTRSGQVYYCDGQTFGQYDVDQGTARALWDPTASPGTLIALAHLLEDRTGVLWFGGEGGLFKYVPSNQKFTIDHFRNTVPLNFYEDKARPVFEDKQGVVWESTRNGLVMKVPNPDREPTVVHFPFVVLCMLEDPEGRLWFGTREGIKRWDPETSGFTGFMQEQGLVTSLATNAGRLVVGTFGEGLFLFDPREGTSTPLPLAGKGALQQPPSAVIYTLLTDRHGDLWVSDIEKIFRWSPRTRTISPVQRSSWAFDLHEDQQGRIWAASPEYGLLRISQAGPDRPWVAKRANLPVRECYSILEDEKGNLWLAADLGLVKYDPGLDSFQVFNESDGIPRPGLSMAPPAKMQDGSMLFSLASESGVLGFHPDSLTLDPHPPQVVFTELRLPPGSEAPSDNGHQSIQLHATDRVSLRYDRNTFTVTFAALHFASPDDNVFAYRIAEQGTEWDDLGNRREITFANLAPGTYTLQVKAANHDRVWSSDWRELTLEVFPPWWRTSWAYLGYSLSLAMALYFFLQLLTRQRLVKVEAARLKELDAVKTGFYANLTHEFRTPLTLILGITEQLKRKTGQAIREDLDRVSRNGQALLRLINHLLDLSRAESSALPVQMVHSDIVLFLRSLLDPFLLSASEKGIDLAIEAEVQTLAMDYDPEKLQYIISNLVSNALKYTAREGEVRLRLWHEKPATPSARTQSPERLWVEVSDSGVGIAEEDLPSVFDRFYRGSVQVKATSQGTGIGLALTRQLVRLLGGEITVSSQVGLGSRFRFWLPVSHHAEQAPAAEAAQPERPVEAEARPSSVPNRMDEAQGKPMLLLVEDHTDMVRYLQDLLRDTYRIVVCEDGKAALDSARSRIPDIILSDVMMPQMDGLTLLAKLKGDTLTSHIPVILLTARADLASRLQGLEREADAYLTKPFNQDELFLVLHRSLNLRRKLQKRYSQAKPWQPTDDPALRTEDEFMHQLHQIFESHLDDEQFGVEGVCKALAMSRSQVYRKVKALTGQPVQHYLQAFRLAKARKLLATTSQQVTEVAFNVGFKDPSHFSKAFRKAFGKSPLAWRKSLRKPNVGH